MKSFRLNVKPIWLFAAFLTVCLMLSCTDDAAREKAVSQALAADTASDSAPSTPVTASQPATVGTLTLSASKVTADKGGQTCIAVTARDFKEVVSMQYTMKWDKELLKFKEVKGFGLPGLSSTNFGVQLAGNGTLTYSWYDPSVQGVTKPDGSKLYEVCFDVVGQPGGKSYFRFTESPTVIEISNSDSQFLSLNGEEGAVEIR